MKEDTILVVLAGGSSSRFWPLPHKMLMSFLGKTFLEHQLAFFNSLGFQKIVLVVSKEVANRISSSVVEIVIQTGEGQGAAILSAAKNISGKSVVVVNADDIVEKSIFEKLASLDGKQNIIVGYKTNKYFPGGYLVLNGKRVMRVHEKPGEGNEPSNYIGLTCDYFVKSDTLLSYLDKNKQSDPNNHYEQALSHMMSQGNIFEMLEYTDTWIPIKYPWHALQLTDYYLKTLTKSKIATNAVIHKSVSMTGPIIIEDNVRVMEYTKLVGPLYIGAGTIIGNHSIIRQSMIGENSVIGFGSDVTRSFVGANVWLHSNYVGDSVIADDVALGAGAVLANLRLDEGFIKSSVKGIRVSSDRNKLGAIIGTGARIGVESQIMPGIKVGQNSVVGPGVQLKVDLEDKMSVYVKQELEYHKLIESNVRDRNQFRKKI